MTNHKAIGRAARAPSGEIDRRAIVQSRRGKTGTTGRSEITRLARRSREAAKAGSGVTNHKAIGRAARAPSGRIDRLVRRLPRRSREAAKAGIGATGLRPTVHRGRRARLRPANALATKVRTRAGVTGVREAPTRIPGIGSRYRAM